jgi:hypothetical protein
MFAKVSQQGRISPRPASARQSIDESITGGGPGLSTVRPGASPRSPTLRQGQFNAAGSASGVSATSTAGVAAPPATARPAFPGAHAPTLPPASSAPQAEAEGNGLSLAGLEMAPSGAPSAEEDQSMQGP